MIQALRRRRAGGPRPHPPHRLRGPVGDRDGSTGSRTGRPRSAGRSTSAPTAPGSSVSPGWPWRWASSSPASRAARGAAWGRALAAALAVASLVVCVMGLPEAVAGIVVNVGILAVLAVPPSRRTVGRARGRGRTLSGRVPGRVRAMFGRSFECALGGRRRRRARDPARGSGAAPGGGRPRRAARARAPLRGGVGSRGPAACPATSGWPSTPSCAVRPARRRCPRPRSR